MVEDSEDDAYLLYSELSKAMSGVTYVRVETSEEMLAALSDSDWDIVISDHSLPSFNSLEALGVLKECGKDIPFIIYSGKISKHVAVAAMNSGAQDAILKGDFARLMPAIERELLGAEVRRAKKLANDEAHKVAFYDSLTGLPNRNLFCNYVNQKLSLADTRAAAVYYLDIDRFLRINSCFGPKIGDDLIAQVGQRLQECVPEEGMLARLGSDEFAVYLGNFIGDEQAYDAAERIRQAFARPFVQGALEFELNVSIGIAVSSRNGVDAAEMLICAETAMFQAKTLGGNTQQFYKPELGIVAREKLLLESALRGALARQELVLEYQPSANIVTGEMTGVEALVRWCHPQLGMLQPDDFIPLANEIGLILEIGAWVLLTACRQAKYWHDAGHPELTMAVNVSAVQFWQPGLAQTVFQAIADTGIDPRCLELEITEAVLMRNADSTITTLQAIKSMGVRISIDDFGTGYSSLSYLRRFSVDILKIDKSFSRDVTRDVASASIVKAISALAHGMGLVTVAEGVETEEQLDFFRKHQCDRIQGFLYSASRSATDITKMLGMQGRASGAGVRLLSSRVGEILTG